VVQYPTYQQLLELPRTQGAEVSLWRMREEDGWLPDLAELEGLVRPETRVIVVK
jgi:aspartate/methionine/tyrosine aminotransferase